MNKKRKIILKIWVIFIAIILLILLFLLGLRLPKLFKNSLNNEDKLESSKQLQYQIQYIHDTNKINNIIKSLIKLKQLKESKQKQTQEQKQTEKRDDNEYIYDNVYLYNPEKVEKVKDIIKDIGVVSLTIGVGVTSCVVLAPIFASVGPIATPVALFV
uniref:Uncharacterized protein n=1 Tax=Candidatus Phytoplasma tritici TaxID=321961 RepID=K7WPM4_9MOLU|nr:hypothetical protein [Candidatus Phytoplasma tritici]AFW98271.1 hypothetical protein [Candidatus Phytoplasma tritici]